MQPAKPNGDASASRRAAQQALASGDLAGAAVHLRALAQGEPGNIGAWLNLAAVLRQLNDVGGAFRAIREVLRIDPRNFPALLMNASLLEREGNPDQAAIGYGIALVQAPPDDQLDPHTLQAVRHARDVSVRYTERMRDHVRAETVDVRSQCTPAERRRIEAFVDIALRVRPRYQQDPMEYYYPGLPSIEFYDRAQFPWLEELEAETPRIRDELLRVLAEDHGDFRPYVHYEDHLPLDQWRELNHSPKWTAFHFYEGGRPVEARCRRAPRTFEAVRRLPQPDVALRSPTALYSALVPKARIPAHTGVANFRLLVHLPLIVPGRGYFRVGGETREWRQGEAWVFDDTIEHEAWNDSDELRVILICDVWSPHLSAEERVAIAGAIAAADAFRGTQPSASS
jgi:aspartate beta-hydroxylase